ncbi:hypothetical protein N7486_002220 [Penicillium sp. IBT 16267x]|nr:hypothetical protein N7486_002220 [Penicillium sp. IBT 16267x]
MPLAQRWFEETRAQAAKFLCDEAIISYKQQGKPYSYGCEIPGTLTTYVKGAQLAITDNSSHDQLPIPTPSGTFERSSISGTSHTFLESPLTSPSTPVPFRGPENHSRYELRNRQPNQIQSSYAPPKSRSEFRPHIADPSPSDCVYQKMFDPLEKRDFEDGSLYIFDRASSPGHVKIGWTAKVVSDRLMSWSNCGYKPNLLFSTSVIPNAMRVETLTHYELIKEWRRERMCKAPWCGKSHQEWFEISGERAKQVLSDWANFMQIARPYDSYGCLKPQWKKAITKIHFKPQAVTAEKLLGLYKTALINNGMALGKDADLSYTPKIKEEVPLLRPAILRPVPEHFKVLKEENASGDPHSIEHSQLSKGKDLGKCGISGRKSTDDQLVKAKVSLRLKLMCKATQTLKIVPVKKEPTPEQIPLPPSPSPEPASPQKIASSPQCTQEGSSAAAKQPREKDSITNLTIDSCVLPSAQGSTVSTNSSAAMIKSTITQVKTSPDTLPCLNNISLSEIPYFSAQGISPERLARGVFTKPKIESRSQGKLLEYSEEAH